MSICPMCGDVYPQPEEEGELPTFAIGDRIRLNKSGRKGVIRRLIYIEENTNPRAIVHVCCFDVKFDDSRQPRTKRYHTQAELRKVASKAVKIDEPTIARTTA